MASRAPAAASPSRRANASSASRTPLAAMSRAHVGTTSSSSCPGPAAPVVDAASHQPSGVDAVGRRPTSVTPTVARRNVAAASDTPTQRSAPGGPPTPRPPVDGAGQRVDDRRPTLTGAEPCSMCRSGRRSAAPARGQCGRREEPRVADDHVRRCRREGAATASAARVWGWAPGPEPPAPARWQHQTGRVGGPSAGPPGPEASAVTTGRASRAAPGGSRGLRVRAPTPPTCGG